MAPHWWPAVAAGVARPGPGKVAWVAPRGSRGAAAPQVAVTPGGVVSAENQHL